MGGVGPGTPGLLKSGPWGLVEGGQVVPTAAPLDPSLLIRESPLMSEFDAYACTSDRSATSGGTDSGW